MPSLVISSNRLECEGSLLPKNVGITIACEFQGGVIIGADSRSLIGDYINNRRVDKLIKVHDRIFCTGSGPSAVTQSIIDSALYQMSILKMNSGEVAVAMVAAIFRGLCYSSPNSEFLIVGWDGTLGGQVYAVSSGTILKNESICILGSGSPFVYGFIDANYEKNMSQEEAEDFIAKTLKLAISRDSNSGSEIDVIVIKKDCIEFKSSR